MFHVLLSRSMTDLTFLTVAQCLLNGDLWGFFLKNCNVLILWWLVISIHPFSIPESSYWWSREGLNLFQLPLACLPQRQPLPHSYSFLGSISNQTLILTCMLLRLSEETGRKPTHAQGELSNSEQLTQPIFNLGNFLLWGVWVYFSIRLWHEKSEN